MQQDQSQSEDFQSGGLVDRFSTRSTHRCNKSLRQQLSARPADVVGVVVAKKLRDADIRHLGGSPVLRQQHVGRLDVAVDDL